MLVVLAMSEVEKFKLTSKSKQGVVGYCFCNVRKSIES